MIRITVFILFLFSLANQGKSQECAVEDNLIITFANDGHVRTIDNQSDLCYSIVQRNLSHAEKKVYPTLEYTRYPSRFGNFYFELFKKVDSGYQVIEQPYVADSYHYLRSQLHMQYGEKGDSMFFVYDIEKQNLAPLNSDTVCFNLLKFCGSLGPGEYRFRAFYRIGNAFANDRGDRVISRMFYANSDWYHFRLQKQIDYNGDPSGAPFCQCSGNK